MRDAAVPDMAVVHTIYAHHVWHRLATFEEAPPSVEELLSRRTAVLVQWVDTVLMQRSLGGGDATLPE